MSSWIWMKGVEEAIASKPIDPVTKGDVRLVVRDVIKKHRQDIDKVCQELSSDALYDCTKHDDLWILRFLLSQKKVSAAIKAAKNALQFRKRHNLDDADVRKTQLFELADRESADPALQYFSFWEKGSAISSHPDLQRGVMAYMKMAGLDNHGVVKHIPASEWEGIFARMNEYNFQWLDYITRTTGRLTKVIRIIDLEGVSLSKTSRECIKRDAAAMGAMEDYYPQALDNLFIVNPPIFVKILFQIAKPIMPRRALSKFNIIDPVKNEKDRQLFTEYIELKHVPERYGGGNKTI